MRVSSVLFAAIVSAVILSLAFLCTQTSFVARPTAPRAQAPMAANLELRKTELSLQRLAQIRFSGDFARDGLLPAGVAGIEVTSGAGAGAEPGSPVAGSVAGAGAPVAGASTALASAGAVPATPTPGGVAGLAGVAGVNAAGQGARVAHGGEAASAANVPGGVNAVNGVNSVNGVNAPGQLAAGAVNVPGGMSGAGVTSGMSGTGRAGQGVPGAAGNRAPAGNAAPVGGRAPGLETRPGLMAGSVAGSAPGSVAGVPGVAGLGGPGFVAGAYVLNGLRGGLPGRDDTALFPYHPQELSAKGGGFPGSGYSNSIEGEGALPVASEKSNVVSLTYVSRGFKRAVVDSELVAEGKTLRDGSYVSKIQKNSVSLTRDQTLYEVPIPGPMAPR